MTPIYNEESCRRLRDRMTIVCLTSFPPLSLPAWQPNASMSRKRQNSSNGEAYLQQYPRLAKWIHECAACGHRGYRPDLPEQIGRGIAAQNIRRFFEPLDVDESGRCEQCSAFDQEII